MKLQQHNAAVRPTLRAHVQGPISSFIHGHFSSGPSAEGPSGEGPSGEGPSGGGIAKAKEEVNITKVLVAVPLALCACYLPVGIAGGSVYRWLAVIRGLLSHVLHATNSAEQGVKPIHSNDSEQNISIRDFETLST